MVKVLVLLSEGGGGKGFHRHWTTGQDLVARNVLTGPSGLRRLPSDRI